MVIMSMTEVDGILMELMDEVLHQISPNIDVKHPTKDELVDDLEKTPHNDALMGPEGFDEYSKGARNKSSDELRCPRCGYVHENSRLSHTYRICIRCMGEVRQSDELLVHQEDVQKHSLLIIAASYGHPMDAKHAQCVKDTLQGMVIENTEGSLLHLTCDRPLYEVFGCNPCPGEVKVLFIRYVISGIRGQLKLAEKTDGILSKPVVLRVPAAGSRRLIIMRAKYGQVMGSGSSIHEVAEVLQGFADLNGGTYMEIPSNVSALFIFGDPCPQRRKELVIEYQILGCRGEAIEYEKNGHLLKPVVIQATPMVAPQIIIKSAYYGLSSKDRVNQVSSLRATLLELDKLHEAVEEGRVLTLAENKKLESKNSVEKELKFVSDLNDTACIDITQKIQYIIDVKGYGRAINLPIHFNLAQLFGDPVPGYKKIIEINYYIQGLGENTNDNVTDHLGQKKNFIQNRKAKVRQYVSSDGSLEDELHFQVQPVFSPLSIIRASFGHPSDILKAFDVTAPVEIINFKSGGDRLEISRKFDLLKEFGEPCRGVRKALLITYEVRTVAGRLQIDEVNDKLRCWVRLGYPPFLENVGGLGIAGPLERCTTKNFRLLNGHNNWPMKQEI